MIHKMSIKQEEINDLIASETYTLLPSGRRMVCELILKNGYSILGAGAVLDGDKFDEARSRESARNMALPELYSIVAYNARTRMTEALLKDKPPKAEIRIGALLHLDSILGFYGCPAVTADTLLTSLGLGEYEISQLRLDLEDAFSIHIPALSLIECITIGEVISLITKDSSSPAPRPIVSRHVRMQKHTCGLEGSYKGICPRCLASTITLTKHPAADI